MEREKGRVTPVSQDFRERCAGIFIHADRHTHRTVDMMGFIRFYAHGSTPYVPADDSNSRLGRNCRLYEFARPSCSPPPWPNTGNTTAIAGQKLFRSSKVHTHVDFIFLMPSVLVLPHVMACILLQVALETTRPTFATSE